ncbi:MAG: rhomboid family intramembrane serine protease [Saprospiraceae bacterium]|nr:rhomboid family intramembrane serine protease [Saprospiraceae bacterium]MBK6564747.1 rhomboid family intramembrane serine protease [Saprospiraceae bacterium]MBK7523390.1 rhomboid family intramembrane serine protease [Saprospiraceae bacterium]MBK8371620.1 rhomboid family intramembrane serine protease [Saprospiraceae bacterium]MBK8548883.1 rhomboid family intramembrane serine protease [Saprospiraceae bacterium]
MLRITDVVKNLIIINVIVFFAVRYLIPVPGIERFFVLVYPGLEVPDLSTGVVYKFEPVQLVTHMFMHGDERHLLFNMLGLFFLGPLVESALGAKRFFILYILSGFFATLLHFIFNPGIVVGASGAVYGTLAAFATMFPNIELMMMFIPVPIKAKYMALGLIAIGLYMGFSQSNDQIAHLAHVGGALMGFILVRYWKMENLR